MADIPGGGGFTDIMVSILVEAVEYILSALNYVWAWIQQATRVLAQYLLNVAKSLARSIVAIGKFFGRLWGWLRRFYTDVIKPIIRKIDQFIQWLQRTLKRIFGPVLELLQKIRKEIQKFYDKFLKPILDVIDALRLVLRGLSVLGVDWARELDAKLARLQQLLTEPILQAIKRINEIAGWIDRIMTLDGLFQRLAFLRTLGALQRPIIRWAWNSQSTPVSSGEIDAAKRKNKPRSAGEIRAAVNEYSQFGGGPFAARINENRTAWRTRFRNAA